jgi:flavin-binding protein dodecin
MEISATSPTGFDDAVNQGIQRARKTIRNLNGAWIKDHKVEIGAEGIEEYKVQMLVTFVLDE